MCKELAPCPGRGKGEVIADDEKLGVGVYQKKYFGNNLLYVDPEWSFYNALGRKKITSQLTWNPFVMLWRIAAMTGRFMFGDLKIDGNLVGEGVIVGGVYVFRQEQLVYYATEPMEHNFNYDEVAAAASGKVWEGSSEGTFVSATDAANVDVADSANAAATEK